MSVSKLYNFAKFLGIDIKYFFDKIDTYKVLQNQWSYVSNVEQHSFANNIKSKAKEIANVLEYFAKIQAPDLRKSIALLMKSFS